MEDFDKYLGQLVENFFDTGKLVLNEQNEAEEGVTTYDIEEYVNDLEIPDVGVEELNFLEVPLSKIDKENIEINDIDVLTYLKDEGVEFKLDLKKGDVIESLCSSLNSDEIKIYIDIVKEKWETSNRTEKQKSEYLIKDSKDFCNYWNIVLSKCTTNEKFFKYCKPPEDYINENTTNIEILKNIQSILDLAEISRKGRNQNYPKAIRLWKEAVKLFKEEGEPEIFREKIEDVITMINNFSDIFLPQSTPEIEPDLK
jgi:hypothetical protein